MPIECTWILMPASEIEVIICPKIRIFSFFLLKQAAGTIFTCGEILETSFLSFGFSRAGTRQQYVDIMGI